MPVCENASHSTQKYTKTKNVNVPIILSKIFLYPDGLSHFRGF